MLNEIDLKVRYPEVESFADLMRKELYANRGKGDQPVWRVADPKNLAYDISWHLVKLMSALKEANHNEVREYSADVANLAMMVWEAYYNQAGL